MASLSLLAGLLLPWLAGMAVLVATSPGKRRFDGPGEIAWIAGAGYLVGAFVLTLWMRALSAAGIGFSAATIAAPLLAATAAVAYHAHRRHGAALRDAARAALAALLAPPELDRAARLAWQLLLAWIALRFALLGFEVLWRPLYPWDAWIQWATKARVWYELGMIVPFVHADAWFAADGAAYYDAAPGYPPTVPLLQVWACVALGRWDDTLMNWPWWQMAAALTLAVYGTMRTLGLSALGALVAAYFVASLPLLDVHVALAGYGDLPMAAYYTGAVLAFLRWTVAREPHSAVLVALLALACTQIKNPGLAWAFTLVFGALVALWPKLGVKVAGAGLGALLFVVAVLAQTHPVLLGYALHLDFVPAWAALGENYFLLGSWNLLWYGTLAAVILAGRQLVSTALAPLTMIVAAAAVVLFVLVSFTNARAWLGEWTTINRATLQIAPVVVIFIALAFRATARHWADVRATAHASRG